MECLNCKKKIESGFKFCPTCGSPVTMYPECKKCKKKISRSAKFCPYCGHTASNDTALKKDTKPAGALKSYSFRKMPVRISEGSDFKQEFRLDDKCRPLNYVKNIYHDNDSNMITDEATGLMWQKAGSELLDYKACSGYIKSMSIRASSGYTNWRLPTIPELISLLEPSIENNDLYIDPLFDYQQRYSWSSDLASIGKVWYINFSTCKVDWYYANSENYVRAVRSI